ncbi:MAG: hypothetical protein IBX61_08430 [Thermoleophilia bacterium]|nr:hypothetical protein [Thermoleophilia bacterium]
MKILHIIKEFTESGAADTVIEDDTGMGHDVTVFRLKEDKDYDKLVDLIFSSDQVYTW